MFELKNAHLGSVSPVRSVGTLFESTHTRNSFNTPIAFGFIGPGNTTPTIYQKQGVLDIYSCRKIPEVANLLAFSVCDWVISPELPSANIIVVDFASPHLLNPVPDVSPVYCPSYQAISGLQSREGAFRGIFLTGLTHPAKLLNHYHVGRVETNDPTIVFLDQ